MRIAENARFCSNCGASVKESTRYKTETITQTFKGNLFSGINEKHIPQMNEFLKNGNFQRVFWNFSVDRGIVSSVTLVCEKIDKPLHYRFGIHLDQAPVQKIFGGFSTLISRWNVDEAIQKFQSANPHCKIKATRPVHHHGINTMLFLLYQYDIK